VGTTIEYALRHQVAGEKPEEHRNGTLHSESERPGLAARSARALQWSAFVRADNLVLEALEKKLAAATRAERLVAFIPNGRFPAGDAVVGSTKLLDGRPACARGYEDLTQAVAAEIAIELSSKSHFDANPPVRKTAETDPLFQYRRSANPVSVSLDTYQEAEGFGFSEVS
jgi:hypothetical protein